MQSEEAMQSEAVTEKQENKGRSCGAKTRAGTPCQRAPMMNGRCSKHGGKSLAGFASPRFKHGCYCRDFFTRVTGTVSVLREAGAVVETMEELDAAMRTTPIKGCRIFHGQKAADIE